jgi:hypothetical protein
MARTPGFSEAKASSACSTISGSSIFRAALDRAPERRRCTLGARFLEGGHDVAFVRDGTFRYDLAAEKWSSGDVHGGTAAVAHWAYAVDPACGTLFLAGGDHADHCDTALSARFSLRGTPRVTRLASSTCLVRTTTRRSLWTNASVLPGSPAAPSRRGERPPRVRSIGPASHARNTFGFMAIAIQPFVACAPGSCLVHFGSWSD